MKSGTCQVRFQGVLTILYKQLFYVKTQPTAVVQWLERSGKSAMQNVPSSSPGDTLKPFLLTKYLQPIKLLKWTRESMTYLRKSASKKLTQSALDTTCMKSIQSIDFPGKLVKNHQLSILHFHTLYLLMQFVILMKMIVLCHTLYS